LNASPTPIYECINIDFAHALPIDSIAARYNSWPQTAKGFTIRERWLFDSKRGKMVVHIIALGPDILDSDKILTIFLVKFTGLMPQLATCPLSAKSGTNPIKKLA
jgi:hypothetical protein